MNSNLNDLFGVICTIYLVCQSTPNKLYNLIALNLVNDILNDFFIWCGLNDFFGVLFCYLFGVVWFIWCALFAVGGKRYMGSGDIFVLWGCVYNWKLREMFACVIANSDICCIYKLQIYWVLYILVSLIIINQNTLFEWRKLSNDDRYYLNKYVNIYYIWTKIRVWIFFDKKFHRMRAKDVPINIFIITHYSISLC